MPELAAIYFVGLLFCLSLTGVLICLMKRQFHLPTTTHINANLGKIGLYWSDAESNFAELSSSNTEADRARSYRNAVLMGLLFSIGSWAGFFFLFLIMVSLRFIARPRLERAVYASELALNQNLSTQDVQKIVTTLKGS